MKYQYKDLERLAQRFDRDAKSWLNQLDELQASIDGIYSDMTESEWYDQARNYLESTYCGKLIPTLKNIINEHIKEFKDYMTAFEAANLAGATKVDTKELKALHRDINNPRSRLSHIHSEAKTARGKATGKPEAILSTERGIGGINYYRSLIINKTQKVMDDIENIDNQYKNKCKNRSAALASMKHIYCARKPNTFDMRKVNYDKLNSFIKD